MKTIDKKKAMISCGLILLTLLSSVGIYVGIDLGYEYFTDLVSQKQSSVHLGGRVVRLPEGWYVEVEREDRILIRKWKYDRVDSISSEDSPNTHSVIIAAPGGFSKPFVASNTAIYLHINCESNLKMDIEGDYAFFVLCDTSFSELHRLMKIFGTTFPDVVRIN